MIGSTRTFGPMRRKSSERGLLMRATVGRASGHRHRCGVAGTMIEVHSFFYRGTQLGLQDGDARFPFADASAARPRLSWMAFDRAPEMPGESGRTRCGNFPRSGVANLPGRPRNSLEDRFFGCIVDRAPEASPGQARRILDA